MPTDPNAWVAMSHASSPNEEHATTTQAAYDQVWKAKGWKLEGTIDGTGNIVSGTTTAAAPTTVAATPYTAQKES